MQMDSGKIDKAKLDKRKVIPYIFIGLPAIISIVLVCIYGVNVPIADEWGIVDLYYKLKHNGFHLSYFFAQHNEHRIFFPRFVLLSVALITKWNVVVQMLVSQVLLIVAGICYCKYFWKKNGKDSAHIFAAVPIMILLFSLRQYENMFWGFQVGFYMVFTFSVLSFYLYDVYSQTKTVKYLYLSGICAVVASFSSIHGILVWVCFLLLFLVQRIFEKAKMTKEQYLFLAAGIFCWVIYFIGYKHPGGHPELGAGGIWGMSKYFLASVGNSVFPIKSLALTAGILICEITAVAGLFIALKKQIKENAFACLLIFFGIAVLTSITVGRSGFGVEQALASRYSTFSLMIPAGLYMIGCSIKRYCWPALRIKRVFMTLGICALLAASMVNIFYIQGISADRKYSRYVLMHFDSVPNEIRQAYFPHKAEPYMSEYPQFLKDEKLSVFRNYKNNSSLSVEDGAGRSVPGFGEIKDKSSIPSIIFDKKPTDGILLAMGEQDIKNIDNKYLLIKGPWAVDLKAKDVASGVIIKINDSYFSAFYGLKRNDVALHLKSLRYINSGLEACIPMKELKPGKNTIRVVVIGKDKSYYSVSQEFSFFYDTSIIKIGGLPSNSIGTDFVIDSINGDTYKEEVYVKSNGKLIIRGWAVDKAAQNALGDIQIKIDDKLFPVSRYPRPDVKTHFNNPNYENSGFIAEIPGSDLPLGSSQWSVIGVSSDKSSYYEMPGGKVVKIKQ